VLTLRFERENTRAPQVASLHVERLPAYPGADWDRGRDEASTFASPTSFVAVITPGLKRLKVHVRFLELPAVQQWDVWAETPSEVRNASPGLRGSRVHLTVDKQRIFEPLPGCISPELLFFVDARTLARHGVGRYEIEWHWYGQYFRPNTKQPSATSPMSRLGGRSQRSVDATSRR
jgi:hypothetical protein